jgi:hypothetical protein
MILSEAPSGFLTRPEAAKVYNRSQRALERDLDQALLAGDSDVLDHYKLVTKDGQIRDAHEVTVEAVKKLVYEGMTPVWYVEESWLEERYGKKGSPRARQSPEPSPLPVIPPRTEAPTVAGDVEAARHIDIDPVAMLREQLHKHDQEIQYLRQELNIKNEQIAAANERTRESNILMRELQRLLGDWQEQAFRSLPAATPSLHPMVGDTIAADMENRPVTPATPIASSGQQRATTVQASQPSRKGIAVSRTTRRRSPDAVQQRGTPPVKPQFDKPNSNQPKWYEIPTLKRIFFR